jgi:hypothetical protein
MKADYKAILCAVQKRDKALWDLGDALVAECGAPRAFSEATRARINAEAEVYSFFHWRLEFPGVFEVTENLENSASGWNGGFDVVLGNPPWDRVNLKELEWFAQRLPDIAKAPNAASRKRLIETLRKEDPVLYGQFHRAVCQAEGESHLLRDSGLYPFCGRGDTCLPKNALLSV